VTVPSTARAVIVGGGVMGCSTAYHLAEEGWSEIVVLERHRPTGGSTWHAAGLVGQLRSNANVTRLLTYSVELYGRLEALTGQSTGWKGNGGLRLACTPDRMTELRRQATTARSFGLEMHLLAPGEARDLWPPMVVDDVQGAAFLPTDGQVDPSGLAQALAAGARMRGVRIVEDCPVTAIEVEGGRVRAVVTPHGRIACEVVVNCAGMWAPGVARLAGVDVPLVAVRHQYLVTAPIEGVVRDLPTLRDPDHLTYYKEEVGGLVMGGYEPDPKPFEGPPEGFHFALLDPDWDQFEQLMAPAMRRVPALERAGVKTLINGPESFTPDGSFILGEAPEVRGFFVGAGFNAFGIAAAGGAGWALAGWIADGAPPMDLWPVDIRRFGPPHRSRPWVRARTLELYGRHYAVAFPHEEHESGRPERRSPLYDRLQAAGARFGEKLGWERPNWFAQPGDPPEIPTFGRPGWHDAVAREHRACREDVVLFDQTSFAKLLLIGPEAPAAIAWLCAGRVDRPPGRVTYTQMLNAEGGIEADVTVTRIDEQSYYIVTGTGFATRDSAWIRRHLDGRDAHLVDVTSAFATLSLMGPRSRKVLARVTDDDVGNTALPFGHARRIAVGGARLWALRVTYVGELGFELHVPTESAVSVYDRLVAAGAGQAGYRAIESLRLEKGYRAWGSDIGPDSTPLEAGLGFAVRTGGPPFQGRDALAARGTPTRLLRTFTVADPEVVLLGRETILEAGRPVGWLTSAGFGHTIGRPIGLGYVNDPHGVTESHLQRGAFDLEVAGERLPCQIHRQPLYDPAMTRVRA
jgi:sarcosine dehydrogenase